MKISPANLNRKNLHELVMGAIAPRPIALVSSVGEDGIFNLAPFSCFAPLCLKPPLIGLHITWRKDGQKKDTLKNVEFSKDFVVNAVNESLAKAMNQTSAEYPSNVDEFKEVGLTPINSELVKAPRVADSPINMECKLVQILEVGEVPTGGHIIIGEIVLIHVEDEFWTGDHADMTKLRLIGRLGGEFYCRTIDIFEMERPYILD